MVSLSQAPQSWGLASSSWHLLGHVSHRARWSAPLMSKGSKGACTPSGIATFPFAALHGTASSRYQPPRFCLWTRGRVVPYKPTVSPLLTPVASRNALLYQSLPTSIPYRHAIPRRRNDEHRVGTAERRIVERLYRFPRRVQPYDG